MTSSKNGPAQRMTARDYDILRDIGQCGALTAEQIAIQHFGVSLVRRGKATNPDAPPVVATFSNTQRRMRFLAEQGYVKRIERYQLLSEGRKPYLFALTLRGAQALAAYRDCPMEDIQWRKTDSRLRPNYIEHLILTNDIRLAVERALRDHPTVTLVTWHDERMLAEQHKHDRLPLVGDDGAVQHVTLIPDAYFLLRTGDGTLLHHFVEIDRSTEMLTSSNESYRTWERKIRTYQAFFASTEYRRRYQTDRGKLLTVTVSKTRMDNLGTVTGHLVRDRRYWFTTRKKVTEPKIVQRTPRTTREHGYVAVLPDILAGPHWVIARNDERRHERHALLEHVSGELALPE